MKTDSGDFRIGLTPLTFSSDFGINEVTLTAEQEEDGDILDDSEGMDEDEATNAT